MSRLIKSTLSRENAVPLFIAAFVTALTIVFHDRYGYFRDELYYIACSNHLDFGYVDQPPLSILILRVVRALFGDSLQAIRLLAALLTGGTIIISAAMAKKLGGGKFAQGFAALAVAVAPGIIGHGRSFSMNSFDVLFWTAALYVVIEILEGGSPKLWLLFGAIAGLGLENKYSVGFLCIGLTAGLLLTSNRKHLLERWFWSGALLAFALFLPHIVWEYTHQFPTLEFMRNATEHKNVQFTALEFFVGQLREVNYFAAPIWIFGLWFFFFNADGKHNRAFGWMYLAIFAIMVAQHGKPYYLAPIYPIFFAAGAVFIERLIAGRGWGWVKFAFPVLLILSFGLIVPFALPVLTADQFIAYEKALGAAPHPDEHNAVAELPQYYADQFGWEEMVKQIANAYQTLTPAEQAQCVVYVRNYGEAGAVDFFGKQYGIPNALCGHNNYWLWGPGTRPGNVAIIFGTSYDSAESYNNLSKYYKHVQYVGTTSCRYAMPFENDRPIFLCKDCVTTFQAIWPDEKFFI